MTQVPAPAASAFRNAFAECLAAVNARAAEEGRFVAFADALRFILAVKRTGIRVAAVSSSRDARTFLGAGFVTPLAGDMLTMPGLPHHPAGGKIDLDAHGNVCGLF